MRFQDLREFILFLEKEGKLKRISQEIDPYLEITEISDRTLQKEGPALLFEHPKGHTIPVLTNLFGTVDRVALGLGQKNTESLKDLGAFLAFLREPEPPENFKDALAKAPKFKKILAMRPKWLKNPPCQEVVIEKDAVDLSIFPIQHCWPDDVAPLITWGLTITKGPNKRRQNIGIYRQQVIGKNRIIMRWLTHRGGALDYRDFRLKNPDEPFPVAIALGADPATILAAVTPIPDGLSEYAFAGLLRDRRTLVSKSMLHNDLAVPATAEIILEGYIYPEDMAAEGPYGDHTGYYNEVDHFPVMTIERITHRQNPIYHSTYTGRPPDEPAILGKAFNDLFIPILQKQFPEIIDFYLPPEGCSYRMAIISIKKQYTGHAKRVMMGVWSYLRQFMYTKFIVVVDDDINCRDWEDVIWAITTRMDPARDTVMIENTPIDYLDFASPISGLGSKMGLDATNKWEGETEREWGVPIIKDPHIVHKIDTIWDDLNLFD